MVEPTYTSESMLDALLDRHQIVTIVVWPRKCPGLADFPPDAPLRIDLGHSMQPPMQIRTGAAALEFSASFRGRVRPVSVPWAALMFAGTEAALLAVLAKPVAAPAAAPVEREQGSNVIRANFGAGRKKG